MLTNELAVVAPWVTERTGDDFPGGAQAAIGLLNGDKLVAGVVYDHYTEACVTATIAVESCRLPRGLVRAMFRYPFLQMDVPKIIVYVNSSNIAARRLAERLGFAIEGCIKNVYLDGNMLILGLLKSDCRWLT